MVPETLEQNTLLLHRSRSDAVGVFVCIAVVIIVFTFEAFGLTVTHEVQKQTKKADSQTLNKAESWSDLFQRQLQI